MKRIHWWCNLIKEINSRKFKEYSPRIKRRGQKNERNSARSEDTSG